ncbi:ComEA family DNA-binding protein [Actinacidiphila bryophytorum]|uniref:ComEA family DNA-binding protein n=1 Tax=Actinacidiphila bryophytorum TaxID=1436133 RepID=UPI002176D214|nr:ComEA family DNA-binding protein [Actinacidiphila bryophytorum]UWE08488.1 ComEA family DNA-binding protein [Actinacidiphila bryophytorum]
MNANPLGQVGPITVIRPRRKAAAQAMAAHTRERASAIFGARDDPPPPPEPLPPPPPAGGRLDGLRTWLLLRCGLEFRTVLALAVVLLVAAGLAVRHYVAGRPHAVRVPAAVPAAAAPPAPATTRPALTVDIAGKVAHPGLRRLPSGSRVADALTAAGGPLPGTDTTALNLARPLTDGEQLLVGLTPPPDSSTPPTATPLNLNSATAPQLDALPGVGPVLAQHILDFRTQHGGFTTLDQLRQVPGIGTHKFTTLKPLVHP